MAEGYGPEVDMWASGIILYVLLSGRLPFAAENENDLYKLIVGGKLIFKSPQFDSVSESAKDFIRKLIITDPIKRLTAVNALEHPFIKGENIDNETPLHGLCDSETDCFSRGQLMVYKSNSH